MTAHAVRCQAIEMLGYTARQAQFLVLVALHGGYFLRRQYVAFTGTPHGQAAVRFLAHAVAREHVRVLLSLDAGKLAGSVIALPRRDQMPLDFNEQLVVEYYSR